MTVGKKIRFIYNPNSGLLHPKALIKRSIAQHFPRNLCQYEIVETERRGHAKELSREAVEAGFDIVVGVGGDGTINEVASALVNTDIQFGIVPAGSGNGLARALGIPLNIFRAVKLVATGETRTIDVGKVNDKYFFTTSGFGLDALVGKKVNGAKIRGPAPYYIATFKEFLSYKPPTYEIEIDGEKKEYKALTVAIANVRQYGFNAIIAPKALPDDGLLDLVIIHAAKRLPTVYHLPKLFTGQIHEASIVEQFQRAEFRISRSSSALYHLDGEVFDKEQDDIMISTIPKALNVIVADKSF